MPHAKVAHCRIGSGKTSGSGGGCFTPLFVHDHDPVLCNGAIEDLRALDQRLKGILILSGFCQFEEQVAPHRTKEKERDVLVKTEASFKPNTDAKHEKQEDQL